MQVPPRDSGPAVQRVLGLLDSPPAIPDLSHGYLDLIGETPPEPTGIAEWLMRAEFIAAIYQRWWRPTLSRLIMGVWGPGMAGEYRLARSWLKLSPGDTLLDLACGPGNFTRQLAAAVGDTGLVIGLDASAAMLARAVHDTPSRMATITYVRADAMKLPLRRDSVNAVCCFAALHLMRQPFGILDEIAGVLRPGGRIALMTSCRRGPASAPGGALTTLADVAARTVGLAVFGREEITAALAERGFTSIRQRVAGAAQFVAGELPE